MLDLIVLGTMIGRIGTSASRPTARPPSASTWVLLVNLAGAAWLSTRSLTGGSSLHRLKRWQTGYLPVFAMWAAAVVVVLPPLFAFA